MIGLRKKYNPSNDPLRNYRKDEIHPDVWNLLEKARQRRGFGLLEWAIDNSIKLQEERSVLTACNYIRYILLGELSWADVFGGQAKAYDEQLKHYQTTVNMDNKVDMLTLKIDEMSVQMEEMQRLCFNMATMMNKMMKEQTTEQTKGMKRLG